MTATSPGAGHPANASTPQPRYSHRAVAVFSVFLLMCVGGLVGLGFAGYRASRGITGGTTADTVSDPLAPGYVASVSPSPVHLLAVVNDADELGSLVMIAPHDAAGSPGGTLVWTLPELQVSGADGAAMTMSALYAKEGLAGVRTAYEQVIGYGMTDATVFGAEQLGELLGGGSLRVTNPDPISVGDAKKRTVKYKSGELELDTAELADFLTIRGAGEPPENRSTRAFVVFESLAAQLAGPSAPGASGTDSSVAAPSTSAAGVQSDLAKYLVTLGSGQIDSIALPVVKQPGKTEPVYLPDIGKFATELAGIVKFPVSAFPGQRPRVRVLNGTPDRTLAEGLAPRAAAVGGEVVIIGNGPTTDVAVSLVTYLSPDYEATAQKIADMLGVSAVRSEDISDAADIDVMIGANYRP